MPFPDAQTQTLDRDGIARRQRDRLRALFSAILPANGFYADKYAAHGHDVARIMDDATGSVTDALAALPFTTRDELQADQAAHPPFGRRHTFEIGDYVRFHQTSGSMGEPLRCLDRAEDWQWWQRCWHAIFHAGGLTRRDRFVFPFSFGPFIGFWAAFESAASWGALCLPAGGMTTAARLRYLVENEATVVCCTPTYALRMAEVARHEGVDLAGSSVRAILVAGEPGGSIPATRAAIERDWGARLLDHAGMTELGAYAFECAEAPGGLHINETEFIAEVCDPDSGVVRATGDGELVLTSLGRIGLPLIRYRTGDQVRLRDGRCGCGRHFAWMEGGILGRIDDMVVVRGNNVFPSSIEAILREFAEVAEFQMEVTEIHRMSELRIRIEPRDPGDPASLVRRVTAAIRDRLNFRPRIESVAPGSLPRFEMKARRLVRRPAAP